MNHHPITCTYYIRYGTDSQAVLSLKIHLLLGTALKIFAEDERHLGSSGYTVQVQVLSPALIQPDGFDTKPSGCFLMVEILTTM